MIVLMRQTANYAVRELQLEDGSNFGLIYLRNIVRTYNRYVETESEIELDSVSYIVLEI